MTHAALAAQLNDALNRRDRDAIAELFTDDGVFLPSRGGRVANGSQDVTDTLLTWLSQYRPGSEFAAVREFYTDDEGHCEWKFTATDLDGNPVEIDGVDYFRFVDGKIAVKDSYVKI